MSMFKKEPRSEVVSIRLNEERMRILERFRDSLVEQLGRTVSISEAAFLLIEGRAAEVDRTMALHEMLQAPTGALDRIRKRWTSERKLSAAEWDLLASYVQIGAEEERRVPPIQHPAVPSRDSYLALLDAFEAVYKQRPAAHSKHVWYYFSNLDGHRTGVSLSDTDGDQRHEALLRVIAIRRESLAANADRWEYPGNVGRCLVTAIRDEGVDAEKLDQVLAPYWSMLWGLAARGHGIRHDRQPIRSAGPFADDVRGLLMLPEPLRSGDLSISFAAAGPELGIQITVDGPRPFGYLISRYPELVEFRAMLEATTDRGWRGSAFQSVASKDAATRTLWLARGTWVELSESDLTALRDLFRQAWASPDVQRWLHELAQEYGEQG